MRVSRELQKALQDGAGTAKALVAVEDFPRSSVHPAIHWGLQNGHDMGVVGLLRGIDLDSTMGTAPVEETLQDAIVSRIERSRATTGKVRTLFEALIDLPLDMDWRTIAETAFENECPDRLQVLVNRDVLTPEEALTFDSPSALGWFVEAPDFIEAMAQSENCDEETAAKLLVRSLQADHNQTRQTAQQLLKHIEISDGDVEQLMQQQDYDVVKFLLENGSVTVEPSESVFDDYRLTEIAASHPQLVRTIMEASPDRSVSFYNTALNLEIAAVPEDLLGLFFDRLALRGLPHSESHFNDVLQQLAQRKNAHELFVTFFEQVSTFLPDDDMQLSPETLQKFNTDSATNARAIVTAALEQGALSNPGDVVQATLKDSNDLSGDLAEAMLQADAEAVFKDINPPILDEHTEFFRDLLNETPDADRMALHELLEEYLLHEDIVPPQPETVYALGQAGARLVDPDITLDEIYNFYDSRYRSNHLHESLQGLYRVGMSFEDRTEGIEKMLNNGHYPTVEQLKRSEAITLPDITIENVEDAVGLGCRALFHDHCPDRLVNADVVYAATKQTDRRLLGSVLDTYDGRADVLARALKRSVENDAPPTFVEILAEAGATPTYENVDVFGAAIRSDGAVPSAEWVDQLLSHADQPPATEAYRAAIRENQPRTLDRLLDEHEPEDIDDLLLDAATRARGSCIEALLEHGADPSANESEALFEAAAYDVNLHKRLVEGGADPGDREQGLLIRAAYEQNMGLLKWLIDEQGLDLHERALDVLWAAFVVPDPEASVVKRLTEAKPGRFQGHPELENILSTADIEIDDIQQAPIATLFRWTVERADDKAGFLPHLLDWGLPLDADGGRFVRWVDELREADEEMHEQIASAIEPYRTGRSQQARQLREQTENKQT